MSPPSKPELLPIASEHVDAVAAFLHDNMNSRFTAAQWADGLRASWASDAPNHGFMLRDGGQVVGVLCALYSEQVFNGERHKICNPHSWCVLQPYRGRSVGLVSAVIRQRGYHFTMFSPNRDGEKIFAALGFKPLSLEQRVYPSLPSFSGGARVSADREGIEAMLGGEDRRAFDDHIGFPWLRFLGYSVDGEAGFIIYRVGRFKRLPCANILHVANEAAFARSIGAVRNHFLLRERVPFLRVQTSLLGSATVPALTLPERDGSAKFFRSDSLPAEAIRQHYSELVAMKL